MVLLNSNTSLYIVDPEIRGLIKEEIERQVNGLSLVAAGSLSTYKLEYIKGSKFEKLYNSKDNKIKDILEDNTSIKLYEDLHVSIDYYNLNTRFNSLTYKNLNKVNLQSIKITLIDSEIFTLSKNSSYISSQHQKIQ
ncbi:uncharacterized protein CMU_025700 [Cryptosporidium muris RN66]|uniref:Uncharacterized protein n=1 Tax=Cryptosporidium muris (strain RN66) TaxID=441375 RepID=B6AB11_CRYMR|nr:uncharacterized protein CMU_025700 [Cryptosporidium muris RN66]EEA05563.1 hypothetical protein CMU_025700 [Cryptosporidium muris RN66]|eukprot:XP_002139912.1 hypothetical protein [Cryptosporidium muris RN66]